MRAFTRALLVVTGVFMGACVSPSAEPTAPVLGTVESPTSIDVLHLRGTKQAGTGVEVQLTSGGNARDSVVVAIDGATQWAVDIDLLQGDNRIDVTTVDGAGRRSPSVVVVVVLDSEAPDAPELVDLSAFTALDVAEVTGTVSPGEDVVINGVRHPVGGGGDFTEEVALVLGENRVRVAALDLAGNESDVTDFVVVRVDGVQFTIVDPDPAVGAVVNDDAITMSGTRGEGVEVVVEDVVVVAAETPLGDGTWTADITALAEGDNTLEVVGRFPGEDETAVLEIVNVLVDTIAPDPPDVDALPAFTALDALDVTGFLAPNSGDDVVVNGTASAADDVVTGAFSVDAVPLVVGDNVVTVTARDAAGNESLPVVQTVERVAALPFSVDTPPVLVGGDDVPFSLTGTRGEGIEVSIDGDVVVPATTTLGIGTWSAVVTLVDGPNNTFVVTGTFPGEPSTARVDKLVITADLAAPVVVVDEPLDGSLAGNALTVSGTATDDNGAAVRVCVGLPRDVDPAACVDDADYFPAAITGDDFTIAFDLSSNATLSDGDPGTIYLRAVDSLGSDVELSRDMLVFRAPLVVVQAVGAVNDVDLARPTTAPVNGAEATVSGALVWTNTVGDAGLALDEAEGPDADDVAWRPQDLALAAGGDTASDIHVASNGGAVHVVWIDAGDLMYARAGDGALEVVDGAVTPVTSVDVAFDEDAGATGTEAVIAFVQGALVRTTVTTTFGGNTSFSTPVTVSDGATASPEAVSVAHGGFAVAWVETSARDGTLDDTDVVLVARSNGTAGTPVLVSESQGAFIDAASSSPQLATLASGDVAVAWIEGTGPAARGVATLVDPSALPSPTVPAPVDVTEVAGSGAASSLFVAVDPSGAGNTLLFGWLDDGPILLDGAAAPVLVVRRALTLTSLGAHVVVPSAAASSPVGFLDGTFATLAWVEGGNALLYVVEMP